MSNQHCPQCDVARGEKHHTYCDYEDRMLWPAQAVNEDAKKPEGSGISQGSEQRSSSEGAERMLNALHETIGHPNPEILQQAQHLALMAAMTAQTAALQRVAEAIERNSERTLQLIEAMSAPEEVDQTTMGQSEYLSGNG